MLHFEKYKGCKLEPCPLLLGRDIDVSHACTHEQMAATAKFSTVNICMMCAYVCMCVTQPPNKAVFILLLMNSATFILSVGITT